MTKRLFRKTNISISACFVLISNVLFVSPSVAEYVPSRVKVGQVVSVGVCLPKSAKSPVYLQTWTNNYSTQTRVAKIQFTSLKRHSDCEFWSGMPGHGPFRLTYKWKVNFVGEKFISFYVPNTDTTLNGWPDGIISKGKSSNSSNPDEAILNQPAANFFVPGTALVTLQQIWGIQLNRSTGPKTFRQVADEIYQYLSYSVGGKVTQSDIEISFQPGNSLYSFFSRLIDNVFAYQAMKNRLIYNANK